MFEAENEEASDFIDASTSLPVKLEASCVAVLVPPIVEVLKAEEKPLHSTKEETSDVFLDAKSSIPIDLEAKNDDASFSTEVMTKEEEQLYEARLKLEEEEARKREQAARLAFDPNANSSVPIDLEAKNDDASFITEVMTKEEEQLYEARLKVEEEEARKREQAARFAFDPNANSSVPIDLEAKNGDASFIAEVMTKEEEQLYEARLKVEEEEARQREQAARVAFDPNACFSKLDELLTETQLYSEFLLEKMEQITDV